MIHGLMSSLSRKAKVIIIIILCFQFQISISNYFIIHDGKFISAFYATNLQNLLKIII